MGFPALQYSNTPLLRLPYHSRACRGNSFLAGEGRTCRDRALSRRSLGQTEPFHGLSPFYIREGDAWSW
jgi:hypothetical protein